MVIAMEMDFRDPLDADVLARAVDLVCDAEPVLGCRLDLEANPPCWSPVPRDSRRGLVLVEQRDAYEQFMYAPLDATEQVQVAVCLWRHDAGDRLLVKMTHTVGDGVGLQSLIARLSQIYSAVESNPRYAPQPGLTGSRALSQVLHQHWWTHARLVWDLVSFLGPRLLPRTSVVLPLPASPSGAWQRVTMQLPVSRLSQLASYGRRRGSTLNDVFVAAAYRALASQGQWDGSAALRISITVDLRRWGRPAATTPAICNLSSFECPFLIRQLGRTFEETLANVTALTRRRKASAPGLVPALVGHAISIWRPPRRSIRPDVGPETRARAGRPMTLSNEGKLDRSTMQFGVQAPVQAYVLPPFIEPPGVHLCLSGYEGRLTIAAVTRVNGAAAVERFMDAMFAELPEDEPSPSSP
jgi:NRPS condensation-like uncharacterized protein